MLDFENMTEDQQNLVLLLQCANDRRLVGILQEAISQAGPNCCLKSVLEHIGNIVNTAGAEFRYDLLYRWTKPGANVLLWQQLKPEVLAELAFLQSDQSVDAQGDKDKEESSVNLDVIKNFSDEKLSQMLPFLEEGCANEFNYAWSKHVLFPLSKTFSEISEEFSEEKKVQVKTPKRVFAMIERPGSEGRKFLRVIQHDNVKSVQIDYPSDRFGKVNFAKSTGHRFQVQFFTYSAWMQNLLSTGYHVIEAEELVTVRVHETNKRWNFFAGDSGETFLFSELDGQTLQLQIVQQGQHQFDSFNISPSSRLYELLRRKLNLRKRPEGLVLKSQPRLIRACNGQKLLVFAYGDAQSSKELNKVVFHDVNKGVEIVEVVAKSNFVCMHSQNGFALSNFCIFENCSFQIDFDRALGLSSVMELTLEQADQVFSDQTIRSIYSEKVLEERFWSDGERLGIALQNAKEWIICEIFSTSGQASIVMHSPLSSRKNMDELVNLFKNGRNRLMPVTWPQAKQKVVLEAPFIFIHNESYSTQISVISMLEAQQFDASSRANECQNQLDFQLQDNIMATGKTLEHSKGKASLGLLTLSLRSNEARIIIVKHNKPYMKGALFSERDWKGIQTRLSQSCYQKLNQLNESILECLFTSDDTVVIKTATKILYVTPFDVYSLFEASGDQKLSKVSMEPADKHDTKALLYFVVTEIGTQSDIIYNFSLNSALPRVEAEIIVTEGKVLVFKVTKPNVISYLDSQQNLNQFTRNEKEKYKKSLSFSLASIEGFQDAIDLHINDLTSIVGSERAIIIGDSIFNMHSNSEVAWKTRQKEKTVAEFDGIVIRDNGKDLVIRGNPSSRRLPIGGQALWSSASSFSQLSRELILLQMTCNEEDYWALMSIQGSVLTTIPRPLEMILNSKKWERVSTCRLRNGRTRMVLQDGSENFEAKVLLLDDQCQLIQTQIISDQSSRPCTLKHLMMNQRGQLLLQEIESWTLNDELEESSDPVVSSFNVESQVYEHKVTCAKADYQTQFVYTGDYLCWKEPEKTQINVLNVKTEARQTFDLQKAHRHFSDSNIFLTACDLIQLARQGMLLGQAGQNDIGKLANHLQVTLQSQNIILELKDHAINIVEELNDSELLSDPEKFVDSGFKLIKREHDSSLNCLQPSTMRNLVVQTRGDRVVGVYRTYDELDVIQTQDLISDYKAQREVDVIDPRLLWASFDEKDILFQIQHPDFVNLLQESLLKLHDKQLEFDLGLELQQADLRRLGLLMMSRKYTSLNDKKSPLIVKTLIHQVLDVRAFRDSLLKLADKSPLFSMSKILIDTADFQTIRNTLSGQSFSSLKNCLFETERMRSIQFINWPGGLSKFSFTSSSLLVDEQIIEDKAYEKLNNLNACEKLLIKQKAATTARPVTVKAINLRWLFSNKKTFAAFYPYLILWPESFYGSEFLDSFLYEFATSDINEVIVWDFLPQLLNGLMFITYAYYAFRKESTLLHREEWDADLILHKMTGAAIVLLTIYILRRHSKRPMNIYSILTWPDDALFFLPCAITILILINPGWLFDIGPIFLCMGTVLAQFYPVLMHMMLFKYTSKLLGTLLLVIFKAIPFMLLSVIEIYMIASACVFINNDRKASQSIMVEPTGLPFLDAWFMQFLFFAGQGDVGNFVGQSKEPWEPETEDNYFPHQEIIFLAYCFVTYGMNIVLLNILIAVTGDVYDEVKEKSKQRMVSSQLGFLWIHHSRLPQYTKEENEDVYIFVVEPADNLELEEEEWAGRIKEIQKRNEQVVRQMKQELCAKFDKISSKMVAQTARDQVQDRLVKDMVRKESKVVRNELTELKEMLKEIEEME